MTSSRSKKLEHLGGICLFYDRSQWRDGAIVDFRRALARRGLQAYLNLDALSVDGLHVARIVANDQLALITPDHDTTRLPDALRLNGDDVDSDLDIEIILAMARSPIAFAFPSIAEFEAAVRIRRYTARAAAQASLSFDPHGLERPADCWRYHPETSFTLIPGVSLIDALRKTLHPAPGTRAYSFSCYRASEYIQLLALVQDLRDHNPALLERIEGRWQQRAVMSEEFHDVFMREFGSVSQPLPARFYVPGDRVWFRNPDEPSSDVYGYEGSWVYYIGNGRFNNFWNFHSPYTLTSKCLEIYHWRDGVYRDAQGVLCMDEDLVADRVARTMSDPNACAEAMARMMRIRDPSGTYADGGCIDATRESLRWVCSLTSDMHLTGYEREVIARAA